MALLGRRELLHALEELDQELGNLNVRGEVFIVGGAAKAIAYDTRRATSDVDAVFVPSSEVRTAASRVAEKLNLEPYWLNYGAKAFLPGEDKDRIGVYDPGIMSVRMGPLDPLQRIVSSHQRPWTITTMAAATAVSCVNNGHVFFILSSAAPITARFGAEALS
jgi:hypothetical protein